MEKEKVLSLPLQVSELTQSLFLAGTAILSFFVPFSLGHPQWLVGTVVNTCLFLGALYLPKKYFLPLAILPSLGVLARGAVFGPFTLFLVYFLPFIWLGNLVLILAFKGLFSKFGFFLSGFAAGLAKFIFLLAAANIYFYFHVVPSLFLQAMGLNQLATALAGGLTAFLIFKLNGQLISRSK